MKMVSIRLTMTGLHSEGSDEQIWPPLPIVLETTRGPISWEQLTCLIATMVEEAFRLEVEAPIEEV